MTDRDDSKLRALFHEAHERFDPPPPALAGLIRPAASGRAVPTRRTTAVLAAAVGLLLVAAALWLIMRGGRSTVRDDEALRLAAELGDWEAPTDFLLQTPGIEFFREAPSFGAPLDDLPDGTTRPTPKEIT